MRVSLFVTLAAGLCCTSVALAQNTGVNLTDGNGSFQFGSTSSTTVFPTTNTSSTRLSINHIINTGSPDLAFDMQWYLGLAGRTREFTLTGFTARTVTGTNQVQYDFANAFGVTGLTATVVGTFTDAAYGANSSRLMTTLTLTNNGSTPLDGFDAFFSIDNDIAGASGDIFAPLAMDGTTRVLVQSDMAAAGGPFHSALLGYGADASGAGGFSALNTQLTDTGADFTTLADLGAAGTATTGDYAQFVQWRRSLGVGESVTLGAEVIGSIGQTAIVPAPGALALAGIGGLLAARRRRN